VQRLNAWLLLRGLVLVPMLVPMLVLMLMLMLVQIVRALCVHMRRW
jgi:hypothetical protein